MATTVTGHGADLAAAALVVLVEEFLECQHLEGFATVTGVIDTLRRAMMLSRSEAQAALRVASQPEAAFVLTYEGVGEDRAQDYEFTADDFAAIYEARRRVPLNGREAVRVLQTVA